VHHHHRKYRLFRWWFKIPLSTRATLTVGLALVALVLLMIVWKWITGEWVFDRLLAAFR
jgi:phosphate/sulfate permease